MMNLLVIVKVRSDNYPKSPVDILYVSRSSSDMFLKVFWLTLFPDRGPPLNFTGLRRTFTSFYVNYDRN